MPIASKKDLHFQMFCIKSAQIFLLERPLWRRFTNCQLLFKGGPMDEKRRDCCT